MLRRLFPYRGIRVRSFYKNIKAITYFVMLSPVLFGIAGFAWLNQDLVTKQPLFYGSLLAGLLLSSMLMLFFIQKQLYHSILFFNRLDNLEVITNFLINNGYYIAKKTNGRESIKLPKVYLKRNRYFLDVTFILRGNKFQDRFLRLGSDLEIMFDGDFMAKNFTKGFVTYTIAIDQFSGRINVSDVKMTDKGLRLMADVYWDFNEQPHLLVSGGTGGGKTVSLMSLIYGLIKIGHVWIADPKKSDFVGLKDIPVFHNRVFWEKDDMVQMLADAVQFMNQRYLQMTQHPEYQAGKRYSAYGFKPLFLIFDEWAALMAELEKDYKIREAVIDYLTQIVLKGRQAGVFMVVAMQRADGEYIKTSLRDNFMKRLSVGHLEDSGYVMMYGDANRNKEFKKIDEIDGKKVYGRGYIANAGEIAREFYSPYVPFEKGFSFVDEFAKVEPLEPIWTEQTSQSNSNQPYLPHQSEEDFSDFEETEDVETIDMTVLSKQLGKKPQVIRHLIGLMEEGEYYQFLMVDGKYQFSEADSVVLGSLFSQKETFDGTWKDLLSLYFGEK
ncbi:FtsK/SpoIIIE domain-containing protein [Streptococcus entericus]|uniref:FtsK/SpoIIIE domain-containing protein n=1 Tax=Streptococcus entericus TaxID=155680 RepID=UPI000366D2A7|nr:FtsK/SpoIIIE domain-containing protein [Streptococcus entericus]